MTAPIASGWSDFAGWASHPLESAAFSRRTPKTASRMPPGERVKATLSGPSESLLPSRSIVTAFARALAN
jgi:hypothetical protein